MTDKNKDKSTDQENQPMVSNFQIRLNEFGELRSNLRIEDLNKYLNTHLEDKKLQDRQEDSAEEE